MWAVAWCVVDSAGVGRQEDGEGAGGIERAASTRTTAGEPGPIGAGQAEEGPRYGQGRAAGDPRPAASLRADSEGARPPGGAPEGRVGQSQPDPHPLPHRRLEDPGRSHRSSARRTNQPPPALNRVKGFSRDAPPALLEYHRTGWAYVWKACGTPQGASVVGSGRVLTPRLEPLPCRWVRVPSSA
jgi:hypothetical protein